MAASKQAGFLDVVPAEQAGLVMRLIYKGIHRKTLGNTNWNLTPHLT